MTTTSEAPTGSTHKRRLRDDEAAGVIIAVTELAGEGLEEIVAKLDGIVAALDTTGKRSDPKALRPKALRRELGTIAESLNAYAGLLPRLVAAQLIEAVA